LWLGRSASGRKDPCDVPVIVRQEMRGDSLCPQSKSDFFLAPTGLISPVVHQTLNDPKHILWIFPKSLPYSSRSLNDDF